MSDHKALSLLSDEDPMVLSPLLQSLNNTVYQSGELCFATPFLRSNYNWDTGQSLPRTFLGLKSGTWDAS